ncbi:hypothetical protein ABZX95_50180 [Streptomyces sp. NPDC004232]|uniref:hypothetical protein n=1 Tax=unclassified Streptomyces TaxID=2593676 RepID=UPI001DA44610|nr:hypothetical protein [Streptomyces sp. tea 10]
MADNTWTSLITAGGALLGVGLGGWLTTWRDRKTWANEEIRKNREDREAAYAELVASATELRASVAHIRHAPSQSLNHGDDPALHEDLATERRQAGTCIGRLNKAVLVVKLLGTPGVFSAADEFRRLTPQIVEAINASVFDLARGRAADAAVADQLDDLIERFMNDVAREGR